MTTPQIQPRLEMRTGALMSQSLVMTPQLQQAIKLLQMSNLELASYLESEIEKNPLLEKAEGESPEREAGENDRVEDDGDDSKLAADQALKRDLPQESGMNDDSSDEASWNLSASSRTAGSSAAYDDAREKESTLEGEPSLREHLMRQMHLDLSDEAERLIAYTLMDLLDEAGYLQADLNVVSQQLGCELARLETVLAKLQKLEPT